MLGSGPFPIKRSETVYTREEEIRWMQWNTVQGLYKCTPFTICLGGYKECYRFCGSALNVTEESNGFKTAGSGSRDLTPIPLRHSTTVNYFKGQATLILLSSSEGKSLWFSKTCSQSELVSEFLPYVLVGNKDKSKKRGDGSLADGQTRWDVFFLRVWDTKWERCVDSVMHFAGPSHKLCHATLK